MKERCESILKDLTGKKFILFVKRGNTAIRLALKLVKRLGYKKVLMQDQGGWLTYKSSCKKEKLEPVELGTHYGMIRYTTIKYYSDCALLMNSMPGYHALQTMKLFEKVCKEQKIFLINDATGSIGTPQAETGDVIFGSLGDDKPINLGHGGFIATDKYEHLKFLQENNPEYKIDFELLLKRLNNLNKRLNYYRLTRNKILDDLKDYDIIHSNRQGINVIVRYYTERERERLINYCNNEKLEYTICPRAIRVKERAVCIEVKRK
ncbi:hypothetical protein KY348_05930 [Candidatus Woesearchaeota archaeon]|nr:hypothetical protein [Candidatus Woesearchaeota archaeon]